MKNNYKVINYITKNEAEGYFVCKIQEGILFEIAYWVFFNWLETQDEKLAIYLKKFNTYEDIVEDLQEISYDFRKSLTKYIRETYEKEQIVEFAYKGVLGLEDEFKEYTDEADYTKEFIPELIELINKK
jgi:hypothetical protein